VVIVLIFDLAGLFTIWILNCLDSKGRIEKENCTELERIEDNSVNKSEQKESIKLSSQLIFNTGEIRMRVSSSCNIEDLDYLGNSWIIKGDYN
jgi:hypothetical protein